VKIRAVPKAKKGRMAYACETPGQVA